MKLRIWMAAALVAELVFIGIASWFGDFTVPGNARIFVSLMFAAGAAFLAAVYSSRHSERSEEPLIVAFLYRPLWLRRRTAVCSVRGGERQESGSPTRNPPLVPSATSEVLRCAQNDGEYGHIAPRTFWLIAIVLRLAMLGCTPGDDMWRYIWEGRAQLAGFNPYVHSPFAEELAALRDEGWRRINHPESAAIYPPAAELVFAGIACVSAHPITFKLVFVAADLLTAFLLVRLTGSHTRAAWYAWNPAIVYAFAGSGHYDSLMIAPMTAAVLALRSAFDRQIAHGVLRPRSASLHSAQVDSRAAGLLGVAIAFKIIPVFLLPAFALALRGRAWWLGLSLAIPALFTLPFGGPAVVLPPLGAFAEVTRFHDLVWWFIEMLTVSNPFGRNWPFTLALGIAVLIATWKLRADWQRCALWCMGLALLLSPVLHPWYVTWILPLAVWRGAHAWTTLSISVLAVLLLWETTPWWTAWQPNLLTRALVIVPPAVTCLFQFQVRNSLQRAKRGQARESNIS